MDDRNEEYMVGCGGHTPIYNLSIHEAEAVALP